MADQDHGETTHEAGQARGELTSSDEKLRALFEHSSDGIATVDMKGRIIEANKAYLEMLGYTLEEVRNLAYSQLTPEKWHDFEHDLLNTQLVSRGYCDEYEKEYIRKNGSVFPVSIRMWLLRDEAANPTGLWAIVRDKTERDEYEGQLEKARENWEKSFNATSDAMFMVDVDLNILQCNNALARLVGKKAEDVPGRKCYEIVHNLDSPPDFCVTCAAVKEGRSVSGELFEPYLEKYLESSADPTFDAAGNFLFALHIIRDITERKRAEVAMRESQETLQIIFDSMPGLIFFKDKADTVLRANKGFADALGKTPEEIEGKAVAELFPNQPKDYWKDDLEVIESSRPKLGIVEPMPTTGGMRWFQTDKIPYRNPDGEVVGVIGMSVDITERRNAEEHLRVARFEVDHAGDMISRVGPDGRILYANDSTCRICGYSRDEMLALHVWDINEDVTEERWEGIWRLRKEAGLSQIEATGVRRDSSTFPVEMTLSFLEFEGNEFVVVFGRDISERKRAEEELKAAEKQFRELAESLPQVVFELDEKGMVTYVNNNALDVFGYTRQEIETGLNALDIIEEVDKERVAGAIEKMFDGRSTGAIRDYAARRKDGTTFPAMVFSSLITDKDGAPGGIRGILTDISERKLAEEQLQRVNVELEGFAHTVSHDLRGPLTVIGFAAEMISRSLAAPQTKEVTEALNEATRLLEKNVQRSHYLIDDILTLAEAGQTPSGVSVVDVASTVNNVLAENAVTLQEKGFQVTVGEGLGSINANPTHVYQVFANLVRNAIKHCDSEAPTLEIARIGGDGESSHRFLVKDNGEGIPPDVLDKIFVPFFKGRNGGTGIGLSTVEKVVALYGGDITAYNDDGACFEFVMNDWIEPEQQD